MLIGVLSDTHLSGKGLPQFLVEKLKGVDLILHAGDILEMSIVNELSSIAETVAVRGNMDFADVQAELPRKRVVKVDGFKIGLFHGSGPPLNIVSRVLKEFQEVDCIIFGHTHDALLEEHGGVILFNPGSPTDKVFATRNTLGFIEVADILKPKIVEITSREGDTG